MNLRPHHHRGFTLLEIMVVIAIIGIMSTVAMIAMGVMGRDREMQDQAERVWAVVNQVKEECELQGFDVGLRVGTNSYEFLRFEPREQLWRAIADDDLLGPRTLPDGLRFRLWLEGREVVLKENPQESDDSLHAAKRDTKDDADKQDKSKEIVKEPPPHIMILSSGDVTSFDLQLERDGGDAHWHVFSRPDNTVVAEQMNNEET